MVDYPSVIYITTLLACCQHIFLKCLANAPVWRDAIWMFFTDVSIDMLYLYKSAVFMYDGIMIAILRREE